MTTEHEASRTLVKSPPELWAECSDAGALARHLGEFGEITITRLEPETTVAWEGERASGTVQIEPSGWGTRVTLTAQTNVEVGPDPPQVAEAAAEEPQSGDLPNPAPVEETREPAANKKFPETAANKQPPQPAKEECDATVEETLEDPDPALVSEPEPVRRRWWRLSWRRRARTRGWERYASALPEPASAEEPESASAEEAVSSLPPVEEPQRAPAEEAASSPPPPPAASVADEAELSPAPETETSPETDVELEAQPDPQAILSAALDSLGQAHHRPFSRA